MIEQNTDRIDWNEVWMETQRQNNASGRVHECWHAWNTEDAAREYVAQSAKSETVHNRVRELELLTQVSGKVLDVGAGPGTFAIPLAKRCAQVTAVEPACGMTTVLREYARSEGVQNLTIVQKKWDDVLPETDLNAPYDLTIASFSLGMLNLRESIEKMTAVTTGRILIYWHAGLQAWDHDSLTLWPLLHGKTFVPVPKSNIVFNLLYSMGIYPDVRSFCSDSSIVYNSFDDALKRFAARYDAHTGEQREALTHYLQSKLVADGTKWLLPRRNSGMRFSWIVEEKK